ncbi:SH3 and cysteine-rich domain-containing protein 3-like isoform X16 [Homarus americanus]|uniref:SH3 and cysteine-rich domain-containing protein 3-like isoform X16 n=1 Tax=Homarus americanus TaxID=6706 RepID=UPI001C453CCC|nr:SH3 and cysteine-rich domain-containing protein 3-like isoform X16 [Homarus americanus]
MLQEFNNTTLPTLLEELEMVYLDVSNIVSDCVLQGADIVAAKALEQSRRYDSLCTMCRSSEGRNDITSLVRSLDVPTGQAARPPLHRYSPPQPLPPPEAPNGEPLPQDPPPPTPLKNELILDRLAALSSRNRYDALRKESADLERQISQLQEAQDTLLRIQQRSIESSVFNKANELQEDVSMKRFDLRVAQVHLSAVKAQKELFASKDGGGAEGRERKMSNSSGGSMKTKWMKAFKSLKTSDPASSNSLPPTSPAKRYTFSSTVLSVMAHSGPPEATPYDQRLARYFRKNAREKEKDAAAMFESAHIFQEYTYKKLTACDVCHQILRGHSRQGLKCRMCKTNVHTECQDQVGKCQPKSRLLRRQRSTSEIETKQLEGGEEDTPSSPVHNRRLLTARNMRMSSVELPDENEKSLSSASTSPCPSPVSKKPHRLLPTNLYVVLYNFTSRHPDELDLRAGYKVTVTDTSDPDWWQGKCLGRTGYFPSKYVTRLNCGEKPLQVTHNLQVTDGDNGIKLLRDQIVIQIGEEVEGMVMIRNGDNQQGVCPLKYLQEA